MVVDFLGSVTYHVSTFEVNYNYIKNGSSIRHFPHLSGISQFRSKRGIQSVQTAFDCAYSGHCV